MWTRRQFVSRSAWGLLGASGVALALPGDNPKGGDGRESLPDGSASKDMITPRTDQAIERGLAFLNAARRGRVPGSFGTGAYTGNVAVTSLAALAFMAAGNQPNRGPYGRIVLDALRFVLARRTSGPAAIPVSCTTPWIRRTAPCTATASVRSFSPKCPAWSTTAPCARNSTPSCTAPSS